MDGVDVLKKILTDSRFWAALWVFLQIPLNALTKDSELGQQMLIGANAFVAVLMAIVFGVSKSAAVSKEVVQNERKVLRWDVEDALDKLDTEKAKGILKSLDVDE